MINIRKSVNGHPHGQIEHDVAKNIQRTNNFTDIDILKDCKVTCNLESRISCNSSNPLDNHLPTSNVIEGKTIKITPQILLNNLNLSSDTGKDISVNISIFIGSSQLNHSITN